MSKVTTLEQAMSLIHDGMTVMVGGFMTAGSPELFLTALAERGVQDLTIITNDCSFPDKGVGKLICRGQLRRLIASYIGTNAEIAASLKERGIQAELVPQGTLAERIRCAGAGLGGFLTPTGVGTVVAEGKQTVELDGRTYLLELPLRADIALLRAHMADELGNLVYRRATRNFNPPMATAAETVIAQVTELVPAGRIDPDLVMTPGVYVDHVVQG